MSYQHQNWCQSPFPRTLNSPQTWLPWTTIPIIVTFTVTRLPLVTTLMSVTITHCIYRLWTLSHCELMLSVFLPDLPKHIMFCGSVFLSMFFFLVSRFLDFVICALLIACIFTHFPTFSDLSHVLDSLPVFYNRHHLQLQLSPVLRS